jgi:hypothetical protein
MFCLGIKPVEKMWLQKYLSWDNPNNQYQTVGIFIYNI